MPIRAAMLVIAAVSLTGCAAERVIGVQNRCGDRVIVDVAMPWRSYQPFASASRYSVLLEPGAAWSNEHALRADHADLEAMPSGSAVVRVRSASLVAGRGETFLIALDTAPHASLVIDCVSGAYVVRRVVEGAEIDAQATTHEWFAPRVSSATAQRMRSAE